MRSRFTPLLTLALMVTLATTATAATRSPRLSTKPEPATATPPRLMVARVPTPPRIDAVVTAAADYIAFQRAIADMAAVRMDSAASLERAVSAAGAADPVRAANGYIPYLALIAAQEPAFVDGVRRAATLYGRDALARGFQNDISYAAKIPGAEAALTTVLATAQRDTQIISKAGQSYKSAAYTIQKSSWSQGISPRGRSATLKGISAHIPAPSSDILEALAAPGVVGSAELATAPIHINAFWTATLSEKPIDRPNLTRMPAKQAYLVNSAISLAALRVLGVPESRQTSTPPSLRNCMETARLQLYQCFSAGRYKYEETFCLGRHALTDPANCLSGQ